MRKSVLMVLLIAGSGAMAQTFTVDDTLYSGLSTTYYVLDSNASAMAGVTGTGVTWDYSATYGVPGVATNSDNVIMASSSSFASDFPSSAYNDDLSTGASLFFTNNADSMTVQGFVFMVDTYTVIMKHSANPMIAMKFPMNVGDSYTDATAGTVTVNPGGINGTTTGSVNVTVDGYGTLKVGGNTHTNILRVKLVETIATSITISPFPPSSGTVTRTIYSYYDLTNDQQALFVHATIDVATDLVNDNYTAVYYSGVPAYAGIEASESAVNFNVYPNPASDVVTVSTDGKAQSLKVINALGQVVLTVNNPQAVEVLDASAFEPGIYLIQVQKEGVVSEEKLIIK